MKRAGKASVLVILGILCVVGVIFAIVALEGTDGPATRANAFLAALGKGDVDGIMKNSVFGDEKPDVVRKKWEQTVHRAEFYRFYWQVKNTTTTTDGDEAAVIINMYKHADNPNSSEAIFQIPMLKVDGQWYVDAKSLNRDMFPALPR